MAEKQRYIIVLAENTHEGNVYAKRAGLPRFSYRVATSANSIRGVRAADVHILPTFERRRDKHAILAELRWAKDMTRIEVEMPEPLEPEVEDQGDGMGPQTDIFEQIEAAARDRTHTLTEADVAESDALKSEEPDAPAGTPEQVEDPAPPAPKPRQRRKPTPKASPREVVRKPVAVTDAGSPGAGMFD